MTDFPWTTFQYCEYNEYIVESLMTRKSKYKEKLPNADLFMFITQMQTSIFKIFNI